MIALVAELVDALVSGTSGSNPMGVKSYKLLKFCVESEAYFSHTSCALGETRTPMGLLPLVPETSVDEGSNLVDSPGGGIGRRTSFRY